MTSGLPPRSDGRERQARSGRPDLEKQGLRGAGWVLAAFYIFAAVVFTGWAEGWWQHTSHAAAPPAASQRASHG